MLAKQVIQDCIDDIGSIMGASLWIYGADAALVADTGQEQPDVQEALELFAASMADSQQMKGYHFFKIYEDEDTAYLTVSGPNTPQGYNAGKLAQVQIGRLMEAYREKFSKTAFIQKLLSENLYEVDIYNQSKQLGIDIQATRTVFLIEVEQPREDGVRELIQALYGRNSRDFVTAMDDRCMILVKELQGEEYQTQAEEIANTLVDMINVETMSRVRVAYGPWVSDIKELAESYKKAKTALEVGRIFYSGRTVTAYHTLGIGRLIYRLPGELCDLFLEEVFGPDAQVGLDDEALATINTFFAMNLNLAETARQLYMHRNTLAYRLEKIQKATGLDIRSFEDAMILKLALMVAEYRRS